MTVCAVLLRAIWKHPTSCFVTAGVISLRHQRHPCHRWGNDDTTTALMIWCDDRWQLSYTLDIHIDMEVAHFIAHFFKWSQATKPQRCNKPHSLPRRRLCLLWLLLFHDLCLRHSDICHDSCAVSLLNSWVVSSTSARSQGTSSRRIWQRPLHLSESNAAPVMSATFLLIFFHIFSLRELFTIFLKTAYQSYFHSIGFSL